MKTIRLLSVVALVVSGVITSFSQSMDAEVPGDHFSLEGALELFKKSSSPEEFEKLLNSPDMRVNNLDLNGDGYIDYVRVHDLHKGNVHTFILQAVVSEDEVQDIAVIELEKFANGKAVLQIIGDEDIYGVTTIIEPTREVRTYAGTQTTRTVVNVWAWPSVQYIYSPHYVAWVSPWGWYSRPVWWSSWRPVAYVHYYPIWRPYHHHYVVVHTRRVVHAYDIYRPYRRTSVVVHHRYNDRVTRYRETYRDGRTRNDGRIYAQDVRQPSRNDRQRTNSSNDIQRSQARESEVTRRRAQREPTPVVRDSQRPTMNRTEVKPSDQNTLRRAEPVRRDQASPQRSQTSPATIEQRTPARVRTETPTVDRSEASRGREIQKSSPAPATREIQRSSPSPSTREVQRSSPSPGREVQRGTSTSQNRNVYQSAPSSSREIKRSAPSSSSGRDAQMRRATPSDGGSSGRSGRGRN